MHRPEPAAAQPDEHLRAIVVSRRLLTQQDPATAAYLAAQSLDQLEILGGELARSSSRSSPALL
ncbi:hypothetical protein [Amycolatopsis sp. EV170708-02-1]|uniref:hypothetical protein n=1 Tax=Amycolatopsis sp. EV170708-02-1 TaxID=2919322 RepID=UPI001F0CCF98|nr:hypothetical protein [Amycolatopsis sp. EV170708-02-1]UMO99961.1 hypothetical protein MJQ72_26005 [Amycolatopsis sp. EV170708-02-1]